MVGTLDKSLFCQTYYCSELVSLPLNRFLFMCIHSTSLDLYANVMHCQSLPGVQTRHKDIDILIVRENTEGEYSSLEHEVSTPKHKPFFYSNANNDIVCVFSLFLSKS